MHVTSGNHSTVCCLCSRAGSPTDWDLPPTVECVLINDSHFESWPNIGQPQISVSGLTASYGLSTGQHGSVLQNWTFPRTPFSKPRWQACIYVFRVCARVRACVSACASTCVPACVLACPCACVTACLTTCYYVALLCLIVFTLCVDVRSLFCP